MQCEKALDFAPLAAYSKLLPAYAARTGEKLFLLCGFDRTEGEAVVLDGLLPELLKSIYPSLSIPETARLFSRVADHVGEATAIPLIALYGHRATPETPSILRMIAGLPPEFQTWMSTKSVGLREISFLSLIQAGESREILEAVSRSMCSKAQGVQLIETWCELRAMNRLPAQPLDLGRPEEALRLLVSLRNPQATQLDHERGLHVKKFPWPAHTQARWVRQGDQAGIEVKFHLNSVHDLDKQIQGLQHLRQNMADEIWKLN